VRFSAPVQTSSGAHPASCTIGTGSFPGVKSGQGVTLTPHPLLVPWSWKGRAIPVLPHGLYGLYWASVPIHGCTLLHNNHIEYITKIVPVFYILIYFKLYILKLSIFHLYIGSESFVIYSLTWG